MQWHGWLRELSSIQKKVFLGHPSGDGTQKLTGQWSYPFPAHDGEAGGRLALLLFSFTASVESNDEENKKKQRGRYISLLCC